MKNKLLNSALSITNSGYPLSPISVYCACFIRICCGLPSKYGVFSNSFGDSFSHVISPLNVSVISVSRNLSTNLSFPLSPSILPEISISIVTPNNLAADAINSIDGSDVLSAFSRRAIYPRRIPASFSIIPILMSGFSLSKARMLAKQFCLLKFLKVSLIFSSSVIIPTTSALLLRLDSSSSISSGFIPYVGASSLSLSLSVVSPSPRTSTC